MLLASHKGMPDNPLSCGVVVVRYIDGTLNFLLLRAYQYWDFPKGIMEEGEAPFDAALREVEEETTLSGLSFRWGGDYYETAPYGPYRKVARYYIAESKEGCVFLPDSPELGRPEHEEFSWVEYEQALALASPRVQAVLGWAHHLLCETSD